MIGATGATGALVQVCARGASNLLGVKMKIVSGYKGSASVKLAITRGEVHGVCGLPMSTITSFWRDDYEAGNFRPVHPTLRAQAASSSTTFRTSTTTPSPRRTGRCLA